MLLGIDVGGTYTDGVVVSRAGEVLALAKYPTTQADLLGSLTGCLDNLLQGIDPAAISRAAISTTLLTNAILQQNLDNIGLLLLPGPGLDPGLLSFGVKPYVMSGAINFRGKEIEPIDNREFGRVLNELASAGLAGVAVSGKFAQRNNSHELKVEESLLNANPDWRVELSHRLFGSLNFPRRAVSTYLTAATRNLFSEFGAKVKEALNLRGVRAALYVLKADGGTFPMEAALGRPLETIYSGPAASVLGVMAIQGIDDTAVILDIGGTTTDIGLILAGNPLLSANGAEIGPFKTQIRSFAVNSVNIGGDTPVLYHGSSLTFGPRRQGKAFCLGGPVPTVTDALRCLEMCGCGSKDLAHRALARLAEPAGLSVDELAKKVLAAAADQICAALTAVIKHWENEPAYRVWEVLHPHRLAKFKIIGVGGAAQGLTPAVATQMGCPWSTPGRGIVANALGAALARTTYTVSLRADSTNGKYSISETGQQLSWPSCKDDLQQARDLVKKHFRQRAWELGLDSAEGELTREEYFNVVRGFETEGQIIELALEARAGVLARVTEGGRA